MAWDDWDGISESEYVQHAFIKLFRDHLDVATTCWEFIIQDCLLLISSFVYVLFCVVWILCILCVLLFVAGDGSYVMSGNAMGHRHR